jgi:hypothetical protein
MDARALIYPRALGEPPAPSGFQFPNAAIELGTSVQALAMASTSDLIAQVEIPVQAHIDGLRVSFESATGVSYSTLTSLATDLVTLASSTNPAVVMSVIRDVLDGAVQIAAQSAEAAGAAADAVAAVPMIGQAIGAVVKFIVDYATYSAREAAVAAEVGEALRVQLNAECQAAVQTATPIYTAQGGTPADLFRQHAYLFYTGKMHPTMPLNVASMYVYLCGGGVTQGLGMTDAEEADLKAEYPGRGIPLPTRRAMWKIVKAILASAEPTGILGEPRGDRGRALMPILQDLVRRHYLPKSKGGYGTIDDAYLRGLNDLVASRYETTVCRPKPYLAYGQICRTGTCSDRVRLDLALVGSLSVFEDWLYSQFYYGGKWHRVPKGRVEAAPKFTLVLSSQQIQELLRPSGGGSFFLALVGLGAAYGAYRYARQKKIGAAHGRR